MALVLLALVLLAGPACRRDAVQLGGDAGLDGAVADAAVILDAAPVDAAPVDAAAPDAAVADAAQVDAALPDASLLDGTVPDASVLGDGGAVADAAPPDAFAPYAAPDFTLTDVNPASATYNQARTVSGAQGKVLLIYFVSFG